MLSEEHSAASTSTYDEFYLTIETLIRVQRFW